MKQFITTPPMPLHPEAQAYLDWRAAAGARSVNELTVEQAREQSVRLAVGPVEDVELTGGMSIPGPRGLIDLRTYYPNRQEKFPLIVFFHGGGWVVGNLETADGFCRALANASQCAVISVNYRHAPEFKFPAAADDAYAATQWIAENAEALGGDASKLIVAGQSAGGNLAAVVCMMARERGTPKIILQIDWVPVTDFNFETESYQANANGYGLTRDAMIWYWNHYLETSDHGSHPYASPVRANDFSNLPPAIVLAAEYDPLRDDAIALAEKFRAAGTPVEFHLYEGMIHSYLGAQAMTDTVNAIQRACETTS
jgi:acetyl esterase